MNDTFWQPGSAAPIFLCVGGEGPALDASAVQNSVHCSIAVEWLQKTKAWGHSSTFHMSIGLDVCPGAPLLWLSGPKFINVRRFKGLPEVTTCRRAQ